MARKLSRYESAFVRGQIRRWTKAVYIRVIWKPYANMAQAEIRIIRQVNVSLENEYLYAHAPPQMNNRSK